MTESDASDSPFLHSAEPHAGGMGQEPPGVWVRSLVPKKKKSVAARG